MFRRIEKIQTDVDELMNLCDEVNGTGETEHEDLGVMILKAQDGALGKRGYKRLEKRLSRDGESIRYYVDFQLLTTLLYDHFGNSRLTRVLDALNAHIASGTV